MSSQRRIEASRANGARSRGPVTPEGKRRSSYNATRHGILAAATVLDSESRPDFEALLQHYVDRFQPLDNVEFGFVEQMVNAEWRIRRCWAIETRTLDHAIANLEPGDLID